MDPKQIAAAWHSVEDRWIVRRNKAHDDGRPWEVIHDWGGDLISDDTTRLVGRYTISERAERRAKQCEDVARGAAVLRVIAGKASTKGGRSH